MTTAQSAIPKWILIVSGIFALMEIGVSISICFSPQSVLEEADIKAKGVEYLFNIWATRQFALGVIFAFATFKKSNPMLTIAYIFLLVMFIGDLLIGVSQKENSLIIAALIMIAVSSTMLFFLNKLKK